MGEMSFLTLKNNSRMNAEGLRPLRFAVVGDSATQHLATALKGYAYAEGYAMDVFDAPYDQARAQIMDDESELYAFDPKYILLYFCAEKLYDKYAKTPDEKRLSFAEDAFALIRAYVAKIGARAKTILFTFAENDDKVFGNFAWKQQASFPCQLRLLNARLMDLCQSEAGVYLIDLNDIRARIGAGVFRDDKMYSAARMPISVAALPYVAKSVLDTVKAVDGRVKKCAVLDLDNTLWGGVIGDDGIENIEIGELGIGRAFTALQVWLKELKNRGVILTVCSKNDEAVAKNAFLNHPDIVLKLSDISVFVANWNDKAENIRRIRDTLNIGMDSMVFLDDNPFERNLVRGLIPEITVPELPEDPALYLTYLQNLNLFETASYSSEDRNRTDQYRAEAERSDMASRVGSYEEYLKALNMRAVCAPFDAFHYPRIAQLTQRSNQFNLRTVRYTEDEIASLARDENRSTMYFCLRDDFGDHGLVAVVVLDVADADTLFVSELLMSCRVLKRGMENWIVNQIMRVAREKGARSVIGEYLPTPKNGMVRAFYDEMGFTPLGDGRYERAVCDFTDFETHIIAQEKDQ